MSLAQGLGDLWIDYGAVTSLMDQRSHAGATHQHAQTGNRRRDLEQGSRVRMAHLCRPRALVPSIHLGAQKDALPRGWEDMRGHAQDRLVATGSLKTFSLARLPSILSPGSLWAGQSHTQAHTSQSVGPSGVSNDHVSHPQVMATQKFGPQHG